MKLFSMTVPAIVLLSLYPGKSIIPYSGDNASKTALVAAKEQASLSAPSDMTKAGSSVFESDALDLYGRIQPQAHALSQDAFLMALKGYRSLLKVGRLHNTHVLTIIDYTLSSLSKRMFVVDILTGKLLYNTYVAHGMNSGKEYARKFSNTPQSMETSLGFYVTENAYQGKNGLALRLKGVEKGINDNAMRRGIVLHGATYVNAPECRHQGFLGRSEGCPAVPPKDVAPIVTSIRNGSTVFAYFPSQQYLGKSTLLASNNLKRVRSGLANPLP
jgi:hypothetical protein